MVSNRGLRSSPFSSGEFLRAADRLVAEGYELVTVSELLSLDGKTAEPCLYTSKDIKITHAG